MLSSNYDLADLRAVNSGQTSVCRFPCTIAGFSCRALENFRNSHHGAAHASKTFCLIAEARRLPERIDSLHAYYLYLQISFVSCETRWTKSYWNLKLLPLSIAVFPVKNTEQILTPNMNNAPKRTEPQDSAGVFPLQSRR